MNTGATGVEVTEKVIITFFLFLNLDFILFYFIFFIVFEEEGRNFRA